jgi:hypothetical protein
MIPFITCSDLPWRWGKIPEAQKSFRGKPTLKLSTLSILSVAALIVAATCVSFTRETSAEEKTGCPPVPATKWRGKLTAADIRE